MAVTFNLKNFTLNDFMAFSELDEGSDAFMEAILKQVDKWDYPFEKTLEAVDEAELNVYKQIVDGFINTVKEMKPNEDAQSRIKIDVSKWKVKQYRKVTQYIQTSRFDQLIPLLQEVVVEPNVPVADMPYPLFVTLIDKVRKDVSDSMNQGK